MEHSNAVAEFHPSTLEELSQKPASGWDPRAVWRERVRDARSESQARREGLRQLLPASTSPAPAAPAGWDLLRGWRRLVRRAGSALR